MDLDLLRLYLLVGLLLHKAVWEVMKRNRGVRAPAKPAARSLQVTLVKAVKVGILLGILIQTLLPDILPLSSDPQGLRIAGAILYTAGLAIAIAGRVQLGDNWLDIETAGVKQRQTVVSRGIYRFIRHPIYAGDLLLLAGLELALNSWLILFVALLTPVVLRQAIREEQMLVSTLPGYNSYCRRTKRFIPYVA